MHVPVIFASVSPYILCSRHFCICIITPPLQYGNPHFHWNAKLVGLIVGYALGSFLFLIASYLQLIEATNPARFAP